MTRYYPPLPVFPGVPTAPMDPSTRRRLVEAIQECKKMLAFDEAQAHVLMGYALLWLHLTLERTLDPRKVLVAASSGHQAVVEAFLAAGARIGVHDRAFLRRQIAPVSAAGANLWRQAKEAQGVALPPLLCLCLQPLAEVTPSWLQVLTQGAGQ